MCLPSSSVKRYGFMPYSLALRGKTCVFLSVFYSFTLSVFCQEKTKEFETVEISERYQKLLPNIEIERSEIRKLAPHDLGHLLQRISGVSIRSYGGLGGMKTLSMRGLGGEHTQLLVNGYPSSNVQSGQTDFGLIQLDNIEKVEITLGVNQNNLSPVSAQVMGSSIEISTFENSFSTEKFSARFNSALGSFKQRESYLAIKKGGKNHFVSTSGKFREVGGAYPYEIKMGSNTLKGIRSNNSFNEFFINVGGGFKWEGDTAKRQRSFIKFSAQLDKADKQLPGAVILYNNNADETLNTENILIGGEYRLFQKNLKLRLFSSYNKRFLQYSDPSYFNAQGFINNQFNTDIFNYGLNLSGDYKSFNFTAATDFEQSQLDANRNSLGSPRRFVNNSMVKIIYKNKYFDLSAALFNQYFVDQNRIINHRESFNRINPQLGIYSTDKLLKHFKFHGWYKQTMRPPSFNELYYSQIGNIALKPENSGQSNFGATYNRSHRSIVYGFRINGYYNLVENKILTLPTKNLFVWSVTNIGKVRVLGSDFEFKINKKFTKSFAIEVNTNITYQEVIDISDTESPTYGNQLAYTPKFTANSSLSAHFKNFSLQTSVFHVGNRYSLNQNVPSNLLDPFTLVDISGLYQVEIKNSHQISLQAGIQNIFDQSYSFIRYFVMPGRNYFVKISYEFN